MRMTKQNSQNQPVYYISLVASDNLGKPANEYFTFDEGSRIDLEDTNVKFRDVHALLDEYQLSHPLETIEDITIYNLLEDFIERNPKASFFVDECTFIQRFIWSRGTLQFNFIDNFYYFKKIFSLFCFGHNIFYLNF